MPSIYLSEANYQRLGYLEPFEEAVLLQPITASAPLLRRDLTLIAAEKKVATHLKTDGKTY